MQREMSVGTAATVPTEEQINKRKEALRTLEQSLDQAALERYINIAKDKGLGVRPDPCLGSVRHWNSVFHRYRLGLKSEGVLHPDSTWWNPEGRPLRSPLVLEPLPMGIYTLSTLPVRDPQP